VAVSLGPARGARGEPFWLRFCIAQYPRATHR